MKKTLNRRKTQHKKNNKHVISRVKSSRRIRRNTCKYCMKGG